MSFQVFFLKKFFSHPTLEKIDKFGSLENGWHYGEGQKFSVEAIKAAMDFHREIVFRGHSNTDAFPGLDGEIQIAIYEKDKNYFTFERSGSGEWSFIHEIDNDEKERIEGLNLEQATSYLNSLNSKLNLCNVSDYYQGAIGTKRKGDSATWRLSRGQEYRSLISNAALT